MFICCIILLQDFVHKMDFSDGSDNSTTSRISFTESPAILKESSSAFEYSMGLISSTFSPVNTTPFFSQESIIPSPTPLQKVVMWFIGTGIIMTNVPVFLIVPKMQTLPETTSTAILSLAITDFLLGVFLISGLVVFHATKKYVLYPNNWFCLVQATGIATVCNVSICTLVFLCLDCYLVVKFPLRYQTIMTKTRVLKINSSFWIVGFCASILAPFKLANLYVQYNEKNFICFMLMNTYVTPFAIILWSCIGLYIIGRHQIQAIENNPDSAQPSISTRNRKLIRTLVCMVTGFYLCWSPFFIAVVLMEAISRPIHSSHIQFAITWVGLINSMINPLIYIPTIKEYRLLMLKIIFRRPVTVSNI